VGGRSGRGFACCSLTAVEGLAGKGLRQQLTWTTLVAPGTPVDEVLAEHLRGCPLDSLGDARHPAHLARWPFCSCAAMAANRAASAVTFFKQKVEKKGGVCKRALFTPPHHPLAAQTTGARLSEGCGHPASYSDAEPSRPAPRCNAHAAMNFLEAARLPGRLATPAHHSHQRLKTRVLFSKHFPSQHNL